MKQKFWIILIIICLTGIFVNAETELKSNENPEESSFQNIIDIEDPIGDDYGPGTYLYPTNNQFWPYHGLLDIERFKIQANQNFIRFLITFGQITNPWKAPFGFSHPLIEIYIDYRPGGRRRPLFPGAKVVFSPRASWDKMVKTNGWTIFFFDHNERSIQNQDVFREGEVRVLSDGKTIQIQLPIEEWSSFSDLYNASYYLLVGGQDGFGPDNFRVVKKGTSEWHFGGSDGSGYGSNVIDLVVPPGKDQKKILGSYDPTNRIFAVVEPVYRSNPIRKGIIYLISILICVLIWLGWQKREEIIKKQ